MAGRRLNTQNLITVASAAILLGTETVAGSYAAGWALANLFNLGVAGEYVLGGIGIVIGFLALAAFVRSAMRAEPIWH